MSKAKNILIITKKKALTGWEETLEAYPVTKSTQQLTMKLYII